MHTKLQNLRLLDGRQVLAIVIAVLLLCAIFAPMLNSQKAAAAPASTINFQARLMNDSGSIAPDGNYNIEFKLYDHATNGGTAQGVCSGNCVWIETRTGGDTVTVANGYVTVNLGSVSAFGSGIDWAEEHWLTMRVGGTGAPTWDTEMSPRLKLTAVPYAFSAGKMVTDVGGSTGVLQFAGVLGQDSTITLPDPGVGGVATVCYQGDVACGFLTGSSTNFIQNGTSVQLSANFNIRSAGTSSVGAVIQGANGQTADLLNLQTYNGTISTTVFGVNNVGDLTVQNVSVASGKTLTVNSGLTSLTGNSTTGDALQVSNSTSTGNILLLKDNATTVLTVADGGAATWQNETDSVNAFRILNDSPTSGEVLGVDTTSSILRLLANNTGHLSGTGSSWNTASSLPGSGRFAGAAVAVNGYLYHIGGCDSGGQTTTVYFARANSDGSTSSWTTTTSLSQSMCGGDAVAYNGYIYVNGGTGTSANSRDIYIAKPNSDGTISSWTTQDNPTNYTIGLKDQGMAAYNGRLYITAGKTDDGLDNRNRTVYYGTIGPDGTVPSFTAQTNWLPDDDFNAGETIIANGYLYVFGTASYDKFRYGEINTDGSVDASTEATGVTDARKYTAIAVMNGYMYAIAGGTTPTATLEYAPLANNGDIGSFTTDTLTLPDERWLGTKTALTVNGYMYLVGGVDSSFTPQTTVYYASGSRVKVGGNLDLVGYSGEGLSDGGSGGQLTAGNTIIAGLLMVSGNTTLKDGLRVNNALSVNGSALFQSGTNTSAAFLVRKADGTNMLAVDTANDTVTLGSTSGSSATTLQAGTGNLAINTAGTVRATFNNANTVYFGNGVSAATPNDFTIAGTGGVGVAGAKLTVQGGNATSGSFNGGNLALTGGAGSGTGVRGLVVIDTPTITTASTQTCASTPCTITQANIDSSGAVLINPTIAAVTATLADPTITTAGRLMYVTNVGTNDFTLSVNGGGTGNTIAMKPSTTATMIWNGSDWTAAGASSSTDLQSAYNNTLTSAGGAELVLNAPGGSADGLTIRNNAATPITGGILEVQTSIGSNLLSVNNNATEYATNGGAETAGGTSSTFPSNTWDTTTGGTVDRWTTAGDNIATGQASVRVQTTTTNHGARNRLSAALTSNLTYSVSFAVRGASNFSTLDIRYSPDGTTSGTTQCATAQTVTIGIWTRISCTFVASGTITSSNSILIRQTDATARTFYLENLSVTVNASATYAADGSVNAALGSNWTAFGASTAVSLEGTIIYDTSGSVQVDTPNNADRGVTNNLAINLAVSTQYLVSFYARLDTGTFTDLRVRYSRDGGTNFVSCVDYSTQTLSTTAWTKITCLFTTDGTTPSNADLIIDQASAPGSTRTFYVDALSVTLNTNNASNVQVGGANKGGPATLFTLDRSAGAPIADNNNAYLGSMYYDTTSGRIQCYEADGWGACGAAPDNIVNLNPEYAGAVLNGTDVGTMTADFCADQTSISFEVNDSLCDEGQAKNFYKWTSPQSSQQTYSIYVTYQLPATFNGFSSDDTVQLVGRVSNTTNAALTYQMYKSTGSAITQCGSGETDVITGGGGSADTWYTYGINGNEATGCSFTSASAGNFIIFKINMKARSNASAYVSTLSFTTTGR